MDLKQIFAAALALLLSLSIPSTLIANSDDEDEPSRKERCANDPMSQWCIKIGAGASLGLANNSDLTLGVGTSFGTFLVKRLLISSDVGYQRQIVSFRDLSNNVVKEKVNWYDTGLSLGYYIPLGDAATLYPAYRGGLFWVRGDSRGRGNSHGPRLSLLFPLGKHGLGGVTASYAFVNYKPDGLPSKSQTYFNISPTISFFF